MKYYFTKHEWITLWFDVVKQYSWHVQDDELESMKARIEIWNDRYKDKFKLEYTESINTTDAGYFGCLIGNSSQITFFLLNL